MRRAAVLALLAGCGSKPPQPSWIERDAMQAHATPSAQTRTAGEQAAPIDLEKLDAATIDALDAAT
ncbi:MAG TPA: hypothetical protein VFS15_26655, partial [Kofleriaceae bacterium]|nr:hypothetical protein [Kofleriaceae bacterium]